MLKAFAVIIIKDIRSGAISKELEINFESVDFKS